MASITYAVLTGTFRGTACLHLLRSVPYGINAALLLSEVAKISLTHMQLMGRKAEKKKRALEICAFSGRVCHRCIHPVMLRNGWAFSKMSYLRVSKSTLMKIIAAPIVVLLH